MQWRPNRPPVAAAGEDHAVAVGEAVTLDGSGSSDPDDDPLSFAWAFEEVPVGSAAALEAADAVRAHVTPDVAGELEASDGVSVTADDADANDHFGWSVAMDGEHALIGARGSAQTGAAYVHLK